jgi:hypothetical protein
MGYFLNNSHGMGFFQIGNALTLLSLGTRVSADSIESFSFFAPCRNLIVSSGRNRQGTILNKKSR